MPRKRGLSSEDQEIWSRVARTARPLHPALKKPQPVAPPAREVPSPQPTRSEAFAFQPFRIGQGARSAALARIEAAAQQTPAERLAQQPLRMDPKTHRRMGQGKLRPESKLDLHGMTLAQAQPELVHFILWAHGAGKRLVLVITGKGRGDHGPLPTRPGALRHHVPIWLHQAPLAPIVQQVQAAHLRHGGEGAYYVYLRR